ncbi:MAG: stage 0 sporulation family protein [Candidatus Omnitrophota bacterium]
MNTMVVGVKLREGGSAENFSVSSQQELKIGDYVIVEQDRGSEYGIVVAEPRTVAEGDAGKGAPLRVIRKATPGDLHQIEKNKGKVEELLTVCHKKIQEHKLPMKLVDAEYSFDRSRIMFYFTADTRVDFRNLVKDLAAAFKARIELKQIGVRDEAKLLGGFGPCGRQLCCATYLQDFKAVTIKMAKDQNLSLNPTKISGLCGRLMCCLFYEHDTYKKLMDGLPKMGEKVKTKDGVGNVISVNALKRMVTIQMEDGRQLEIKYETKEK